jgi:mRNA-degrading endonuclease RelE of RelBE toxin-antitoxin system
LLIIDIVLTKSFKKYYKKLPNNIKKQLESKLILLQNDQFHPSLRTKKNNSWSNEIGEKIYESSINMNYRLLWMYDENNNTMVILLLATGEHSILDKK